MLDAFLDALKVLPILLAVHIIIEIIEHHGSGLRNSRALKGGLSPLIGTGAGILPQCGVGIVATDLYVKRQLPLGALFAVYIATSDEAIPILLSSPSTIPKLLPLLAIKLALALIVGYAVYFVEKRFFVQDSDKSASEENEHGAHKGCHNHEIGAKEGEKASIFHEYLLHPLRHTAEIFVFILIINMLLGAIIELVGADRLSAFMDKSTYFQPLFAALIGLIPNCAASVAVTQMYALGHLSLGGAVAGLTTNAGLAYAVLFKEHKSRRHALYIVIAMLVIGVLAGMPFVGL